MMLSLCAVGIRPDLTPERASLKITEPLKNRAAQSKCNACYGGSYGLGTGPLQ